MQRDREFMVDILEAAKPAIQYIDEINKEEFFCNTHYQDAVIRRIEIIGEAARHISEETQAEYPVIPWSDLISMRNVMIHEYDDIDIGIVWETVKNDLPLLVNSIENILVSHSL